MDSKFRTVRGKSGKALPGLYESDICRVERDHDGLWVAEVPMRRIGKSAYMEYRPLTMGGHWVRIGRFEVRSGAMATAERLKYGELVFDSAIIRNGIEPVKLVLFSSVADEIRNVEIDSDAKHRSPSGAGA